MLRAAALELLLRQGGHQVAEQLLLAPAGQAVRAFASRRRTQPAWMLAKPKADKQAKLLEARVQRLARELEGPRTAPAAAAAAAAAAGPAVEAAAGAAAVDAAPAAGASDAAGAGPGSSAQPAAAERGSGERPTGSAGDAASSSGSGGGGGGGSGSASSSGGSSGSASSSGGERAAAGAGASTSSWMPSFLRGLLPGSLTGGNPPPPRRASPLMAAAPSAASAEERDLAAAAAAAAAAQEAALEERTKAQEAFAKKMAKEGDDAGRDSWDNIVMLRDMTLDEYLHQVRSWKGEDPPRPSAPKRHGIDARRVEYLRWGQHEIIVQSMTDNEKALVRLDPAAAVTNRALLSALAARSGYSLAEVRDAVACYRDMRDRINCLIEYKDSGRPMPSMDDMESKVQAIEAVRAQRRKADLDAVLARRDRANCPVKPYVRILGRRVQCPNTSLPYMHCCGAAAEDKARGTASARAAA